MIDSSTIVYVDKGLSNHSRKFLQYWDVEDTDSSFSFHHVSFSRDNFWSIDNIQPHRINLHHYPRHIPKYIHPFIPIKLKKIIKEIRPDLVHAVYLTTNGYYAAQTHFKPLLLQGLGTDINIQLKKWPYSHWVKKALLQADMLIVDANTIKRNIQENGFQDLNVQVIPMGINIEQFSPNKDNRNKNYQERFDILCNRKHESIYGWTYLFKALSIIRETIPHVRLFVLGQGVRNKYYQRLIRRNNLTKNINWVGHVPNHLMPSYLQNVDVYISPSLSDGSSVSLQEAMACELPVVVTDNPAIMEWITHGVNGLVVPRRDYQALAEAVINLYYNENLSLEFGKNNRDIALEKSSFDKYISQVNQCYSYLL